jgi:hypothetical protein
VNPEAWLEEVFVRIWVRGVFMDDRMPWSYVKGGVAVLDLRMAACPMCSLPTADWCRRQVRVG